MDPDQDSNPDPDPAIFVSDLQDIKVHLHHFSKKKKVIKKSQNSRNNVFLSIFA
jgi:hypothetical protein